MLYTVEVEEIEVVLTIEFQLGSETPDNGPDITVVEYWYVSEIDGEKLNSDGIDRWTKLMQAEEESIINQIMEEA